MGHTACTEPQCLYEGALYLYLTLHCCTCVLRPGLRELSSPPTPQSVFALEPETSLYLALTGIDIRQFSLPTYVIFWEMTSWNPVETYLHFRESYFQTFWIRKASLLRPIQAQRFPHRLGCQISRHSAHVGSKVVRPQHRPSLLPRKYSWYSFLLEADLRDIVRPKGLRQWRIPMTQSGIEPATFRLAAQCHN